MTQTKIDTSEEACEVVCGDLLETERLVTRSEAVTLIRALCAERVAANKERAEYLDKNSDLHAGIDRFRSHAESIGIERDCLKVRAEHAESELLSLRAKGCGVSEERDGTTASSALKWISVHYENQDINHVDFRVEAKRLADAALDEIPATPPEPSDAAVAALKKALEPFAKFADPTGAFSDSFKITAGSGMARRQLTMGHCYRAKEALAAYAASTAISSAKRDRQ